MISYGLPIGAALGATTLHGIVDGVHESWVYKRLEDAHDENRRACGRRCVAHD